MKKETPSQGGEIHLIRHTEKVSSEKTPEDVTDEEIEQMRQKVADANPDFGDLDDDSLRHLVLCDQDAAIFGPDIGGKREKSSITFSGILRAQREAKDFAEHIKDMPGNAVIILGPGSPKDRCQETQWIYAQEIKAKAREKSAELTVFEDEGLVPQNVLDEQNLGRTVMINQENVEGIEAEKVGPWGPKYLDQLKSLLDKSMKDKETPAVKVWVSRDEEIDKLRAEFVEQGIIKDSDSEKLDPALFETKDNTPEAVAKDIITYIKQVLELGREKYPDRPVYFLGSSHNMTMDVASLRLLGHKITRENLKKLALDDNDDYEASLPIEGRSMRFENGKFIFSFRGEEKELSPEELEELTKDNGILDQEAEERVREWQKQ